MAPFQSELYPTVRSKCDCTAFLQTEMLQNNCALRRCGGWEGPSRTADLVCVRDPFSLFLNGLIQSGGNLTRPGQKMDTESSVLGGKSSVPWGRYETHTRLLNKLAYTPRLWHHHVWQTPLCRGRLKTLRTELLNTWSHVINGKYN